MCVCRVRVFCSVSFLCVGKKAMLHQSMYLSMTFVTACFCNLLPIMCSHRTKYTMALPQQCWILNYLYGKLERKAKIVSSFFCSLLLSLLLFMPSLLSSALFIHSWLKHSIYRSLFISSSLDIYRGIFLPWNAFFIRFYFIWPSTEVNFTLKNFPLKMRVMLVTWHNGTRVKCYLYGATLPMLNCCCCCDSWTNRK